MLDDERVIKEKAELIEDCSEKAKLKARSQKWDMNLVVFMFAILLITVILLFEGIDPIYLAPIAFFGLIMVWLVSRQQERKLYKRYYRQEMRKYIDKNEEIEEPEY
jgi:4-hydroxybenzoate polyprenyltransferase